MSPENEFLGALGAYLSGAGLAPAAATVGIAEPGSAADLPAVVLSLTSSAASPVNGLGGSVRSVGSGGSIGFNQPLIAGTLRLDVCALAAADAAALSAAVVEALAAPEARDAIHRLVVLQPTELGAIAAPEAPLALRRRTLRFRFAFESQNLPADPGGVIRTITLSTGLTVVHADRATGALSSADTFLPAEELGA